MRRDLYPSVSVGYVCAYSGILLEVDKSKYQRGDYVSFDHVIPNQPGNAVLCSRIVNDLKGWMTGDEFEQFVSDVIDPKARRSSHGVSEDIFREFLEALRTLTIGAESPKELTKQRARLKTLTSRFNYQPSAKRSR